MKSGFSIGFPCLPGIIEEPVFHDVAMLFDNVEIYGGSLNDVSLTPLREIPTPWALRTM